MPDVIERNLRGYLSESIWVTPGDVIDGWEEADCLRDVVESVVVAEICELNCPYLGCC
jgi:hypothetical protein